MHLHPGRLAVAVLLVLAGCGSRENTARHEPRTARSVVVPQLVGHRQEEAHRIATRAGLRIRWTAFGKAANGRYNVPCAKVLRQSPVAGERRPPGAKITIIETACHVPREAPHGV